MAYSISENGIAIPTNKIFYQNKELTDKITRQTKDLKVNGNMRVIKTILSNLLFVIFLFSFFFLSNNSLFQILSF